MRRAGVDVVCDRWLADALVDLRLRYGRQPLAERLLRAAMPRPDVAALLEVPADVAASRKPQDQDADTLTEMERLYAEAAGWLGLTRIDANRPSAAVRTDLLRLAGD
jgi:thymidylate kinase